MEDSDRTPAKLIASVITIALFLALAWWKKSAQFGSGISRARVYVNDAQLNCHVCGGEHFRKREGLVNTQWLTMLRLDWLNESAHCVSCTTCGHAHWFMSRAGESGAEHPLKWIRYETSRS